MSARRSAVLPTTTTFLAALALAGTATAAGAASDDPTPYRVTPTGIELPAGRVLEVHAHVNVMFTAASGAGLRNVHVEGPGTRSGDLVGASVLTWDRVGLPADACVTWVQVAGFDEHFGEGGQAPVCRTAAPQPAAPAPAPQPPAAQPPAPRPPAAPQPAAPAPADEQPAPGPAAPPAPAPAASMPAPAADVKGSPTPAPAVDATPAPTERAEVLAANDTAPTVAAGWVAGERSDALASTGARAAMVLGGALLALGAGTGLVAWRRRTARP